MVMSDRIEFGLFDWIDESGRAQGETYEERLRMLELADRAGFFCYHLAEHHATELSTVPSPNLFLSAVTQRTKRLRLGPLSYVLPMYDPVRLLEEICMLDHISGGRMELGVSRGSFGEHIDNDPEKARGMFNEALRIILMGLTTGQIDFHGQYFDITNVITRQRPAQKPYPPLWYPTSNADSVPWVASQGMNTAFSIHLLKNIDEVAARVARYSAEYARHASDPGRLNGHVKNPKVGISSHVHVADSDTVARAQARPAYDRFNDNFVARYLRRGAATPLAERRNFDDEVERGRILVGSPTTVGGLLRSYLERTGANYVIACFSFGNMPIDQILRSVDLFSREVMPALRSTSPVGAGSR
jgi:alkanesulfonate monooxygenase SsuD/methylene tetrahydromethanopterin reductase-like flavin-dependent oxidoreductase (luciferase family)